MYYLQKTHIINNYKAVTEKQINKCKFDHYLLVTKLRKTIQKTTDAKVSESIRLYKPLKKTLNTNINRFSELKHKAEE